ncbi:MAG: tRNA 2-thiouridine(34) synthase MnmA [Anaerolineae bacterium]|nr:tRNA 2-thiouridine(34) synthase MnmA [Anaerolineae bacterium]
MAGTRERVVVAMSGGVDSSVAAALLAEQGYDVIGVMMRLWAEGENRCCAPDAVDDARRVAARLGIPFYLVNYEAEFRHCVVDYFVEEYSRGRTPNPCLACNRHIRFDRLLGRARSLDTAYLATGHYARIVQSADGFRLCAGLDEHKDQSYVLYMLGQEELRQVLFPLGHYTKAQVREMARQWDLPVAEKDESMELCFVGDDDYRRFLQAHAPHSVRPGPILDGQGQEIGRHQGLPFYTVGQRRGLGIAAPEALYVIRLDVKRNALIVGPARELGRDALEAGEVHYVRGEAPPGAVRVQAKIRYKAKLASATWTPLPEGRARVEFDAPLRDITPGQAVVAYQGDVVLGGGIIRE